MFKALITLAVALLGIAPAGAATVLEGVNGISYEFEGPRAGYQRKVRLATTGLIEPGDPVSSWQRDVRYVYFDPASGRLMANEYGESASCNSTRQCQSDGQYTKMIGNGYSFVVQNIPGYNFCTPGTLGICAINTDYSRGRVLIYGEARAGTSGATFKLTIGDEQPIPASGVVPEPSSWAMLMSGFALLGGMARRYKAKTVHA